MNPLHGVLPGKPLWFMYDLATKQSQATYMTSDIADLGMTRHERALNSNGSRSVHPLNQQWLISL